MISRLTGALLEKHPPQVVLEVNGVGYEVDVTMTTFYQLPALGECCSLYTHLVIREDAHLLFGFSSKEERQTFRQLIKISGIGAKIALSILSGMTSDELAHAIASEDLKRLSSVPGIGKKTAERLVLELRGKLTPVGKVSTASNRSPVVDDDILNALLALGYTSKEASNATQALPDGVSVSEGVRLALKQLMKG